MTGEADTPVDPDEGAQRLAEIYLVVGPLYRRVLRVVEEGGATTGVSAGERAILDMLRRGGPMTVPQIAAAQQLSRQFVQRQVDATAARGLTERRANPVHRRSSLIALTVAGHAAIDAVIAREHVALRHAAQGLTAAQIDACLTVLTQMLDAVSGDP